MASVNYCVCLVLVLCQFSAVHSDEASSESTDLGLTDLKIESDSEGVRCYCNTAQCVSTGYMCRAGRGGGCYSELPAPRRPHHARHGCLHHLADTEEAALSRCQNTPASAPPAHKDSLLLCCFRDLCNHEDSPLARARLNLTTSDLDNNAVATERGANYNGEVWFKAATIAVPVCGALILFLLVAVAVRLLKADALLQADRKLRGGYMSPLAQHTNEDVKKVWVGSTSAPLLVAPGGCLVAVERAQLVDVPPCTQLCDIQR
ncbi:BMP and activin membrane-bound inhibitor homolog [Pectinophora gossypiella]|uniref:BMP and activin membrane-bound inhibitor homolog n=1 Tax=Pectinophora gossypiella TaxID=13191 RepID=UPI00214E2EE6|nr:BMP and activin membrane-bound inhibitor homolog [Pectinophora gossypiella]